MAHYYRDGEETAPMLADCKVVEMGTAGVRWFKDPDGNLLSLTQFA